MSVSITNLIEKNCNKKNEFFLFNLRNMIERYGTTVIAKRVVVRTQEHSHMHTRTFTCTHTYTNKCARAHKHTHTHTNTHTTTTMRKIVKKIATSLFLTCLKDKLNEQCCLTSLYIVQALKYCVNPKIMCKP